MARKKSELVTLREQLEVEELKARLGSIKQLSESINVGNNFIPPQDIYPTGDGFGAMPGILGALSSVDRNARGDLPEAYLSEQQLTWARKRSRWLGISNEYARNALSNRQNYIVGQGFQVSPVAREADDVLDPTLEKLLQDFIEEFSAVNQWGLMQREAVLRGDRDGDGAIRLFPQSDGMTRLRFVESDFIKDATGQYSYGIETAPDDVADPLAYWVTYPGQEPVRISADEVVFFKLNTDSGVKRGLPFLYPIFELLNQIEKINLNTGLLIAIQSSYAVIKKTPGASQSSLNTARSANASFTGSNPLTGQTDYYSQVRGGKIIETTPANEYEFPAAGVSVPGFVAGRQALLQTAAAGVGMAEYMLTSDASNGNFSSTMVSESPPLKGFAAMQYFWQHIFGTGVYYPAANNGVLWRAIEHAVESGRLPEDVLTSVRLEVTGDSNEVRDKNQETDRMLKLEEAGVIDNDQVAKAHGYKKARVSSEDKEAKKADEMKQQLAAKTKTLKEQYNPNEPRDEIGRWTDGGASGGDAKKESFSEMMDRIKHEREASQKKWEDAGWSHTEEARLKELSDLDANGHLQGVRNEKAQNELSELRGKKQHLKSKKLLGSNTGVIKGSLKQIKLADIDLMGQRLDEVAPLHDGNSGMPIILAKHGDKFKLLDGYGRTNGMLNAGHTKIHAIVASDADIDKFSGATSDNDEFVQYMYDKYTKGLTAGSQGSLLKAA